jgi:hypothetical protein
VEGPAKVEEKKWYFVQTCAERHLSGLVLSFILTAARVM